ncbi:unnamed protein product [Ambrosiozyma monospora]|uniref:Unnamed protein product n=1 Tax=Ambrosiozyma monospora TaxID=43982 RepID=A0ACB5U9W9_AMBMO|nr:unnamed protein product [Ambrosiozyma monospora]
METQRKFIRFLSLRSDDETEQLPNYISDPINGDPLPSTTTTTTTSMTPTNEQMENRNNNEAEPSTENNETKQLNKEDYFTLEQLISQLDSLLKLIYFSIFKQTTIPRIYHDNIPPRLTMVKQPLTELNAYKSSPQPHQLQLQLPPQQQQNRSMLGQLTSYIIKIMGDLIDYLAKYPIRSLNSWLAVLNLLSDLDNFVCLLIDIDLDDNMEEDEIGEEGGGFGDAGVSLGGGAVGNGIGSGGKWHIVNNTDKIRIESIVNRTKILLSRKFDLFQDSILKRSSEIKDLLVLFESYLGAVYEGISDRTSI